MQHCNFPHMPLDKPHADVMINAVSKQLLSLAPKIVKESRCGLDSRHF